MLLGSGNLLDKLPLTQTGGVINNTNWMNPSLAMVGVYTFDKKSSLPNGYGGKAFYLPMKAGGVSTSERVSIALTGSGAMGINIEGSSSFTVDNNTPNMGLIVSGIGTSTFDVSSTASAVATLNGIGSSIFVIGLNHLAMYVDADGYASASLGVVGNAYGTLSAIGVMSGDTIDSVALTPAAIWSYDLRTLSVNVATKGDVYAAAML